MSNDFKTTSLCYRPENSPWPSKTRKSMINMRTIWQWTQCHSSTKPWDLGYFLGTYHFHVSQNMEVFIMIAFCKNKMAVLQKFLRVLAYVGLSVQYFLKMLIGSTNWLFKSHTVPRIFLNKNSMLKRYFWKEKWIQV